MFIIKKNIRFMWSFANENEWFLSERILILLKFYHSLYMVAKKPWNLEFDI